MVINSSDRAVRVYVIIPGLVEAESDSQAVPITIHELHRFQDTIGKTPWNTVGFSGDGEYVMGGAGTKTSHHIYVWDRSTGVLIKVLEGPKDALDDCDVSPFSSASGATIANKLAQQWSPSRPMIASCTSAGEINIWQTTTNEAWSAFAPGFEELEENREYIEREDEFDLVCQKSPWP
jgi:COMPASS component SWD1